jgi:hypothetical protein
VGGAPPACPGRGGGWATPAGRPADPRDREVARLRRENERLAAELDRVCKVIEVQGKALGAVGPARHRQRSGAASRPWDRPKGAESLWLKQNSTRVSTA